MRSNICFDNFSALTAVVLCQARAHEGEGDQDRGPGPHGPLEAGEAEDGHYGQAGDEALVPATGALRSLQSPPGPAVTQCISLTELDPDQASARLPRLTESNRGHWLRIRGLRQERVDM